MSEINISDVLESMREAGLVSPHPTGRIVKKTTGVIVRSGPFRRKKYLYIWRLHIGQGKADFRDFETKEEAEAAKVLMGL